MSHCFKFDNKLDEYYINMLKKNALYLESLYLFSKHILSYLLHVTVKVTQALNAKFKITC